MHNARIGTDGNLTGKHPDVPSEETGTEMKPELSARILNRKPLYPSIRDSLKKRRGRFSSFAVRLISLPGLTPH